MSESSRPETVEVPSGTLELVLAVACAGLSASVRELPGDSWAGGALAVLEAAEALPKDNPSRRLAELAVLEASLRVKRSAA